MTIPRAIDGRLVRDLGERGDRRARHRSALGIGPVEQILDERGRRDAARVAAGRVEHERLGRRERWCSTGISACSRTATRSISVWRNSLTTASLVGAGSMNADCAAVAGFAPSAAHATRSRPCRTRRADSPRDRPLRARPRRSERTVVGRTSVVGLQARRRARARTMPWSPGHCRPRRFHASAVSGPSTSEIVRSPEVCARTRRRSGRAGRRAHLRDDLRVVGAVGKGDRIGDRLEHERDRQLLLDRPCPRRRCRPRRATSRTNPTRPPCSPAAPRPGKRRGGRCRSSGARPIRRARRRSRRRRAHRAAATRR